MWNQLSSASSANSNRNGHENGHRIVTFRARFVFFVLRPKSWTQLEGI